MSIRFWSLILLASVATALPALAQVDALMNPVAVGTGTPPASADVTPVNRGDFGPCAININFDTLTGGGISCNGTHITNQYPGLVFDVPSGNCVICANSVLGTAIPNNSDPNVAFAQQNLNVCSADALPATVMFTPPVLMVGMDYFTSENSDFRIKTYNSANQLLETLTVIGTDVGDFWAGFAGLRATGSIIAKIEIYSRSFTIQQPFNFSFDDFIYQENECATPTSPASWGFLKSVYSE